MFDAFAGYRALLEQAGEYLADRVADLPMPIVPSATDAARNSRVARAYRTGLGSTGFISEPFRAARAGMYSAQGGMCPAQAGMCSTPMRLRNTQYVQLW